MNDNVYINVNNISRIEKQSDRTYCVYDNKEHVYSIDVLSNKDTFGKIHDLMCRLRFRPDPAIIHYNDF